MTFSQDYKEKIDQLWQKYLEDPVKNKDLVLGLLFLNSKAEELALEVLRQQQNTEKWNKTIKALQDSGAFTKFAEIFNKKFTRDFEKENLEDEITSLKVEIQTQQMVIDELKKQLEFERNK